MVSPLIAIYINFKTGCLTKHGAHGSGQIKPVMRLLGCLSRRVFFKVRNMDLGVNSFLFDHRRHTRNT